MRSSSVYHKLQKTCARLNADAYRLQSTGRRVRQFNPCPKSLILIEECRKPRPLLLPSLEQAALEICQCHPDFGAYELLEIATEKENEHETTH